MLFNWWLLTNQAPISWQLFFTGFLHSAAISLKVGKVCFVGDCWFLYDCSVISQLLVGNWLTNTQQIDQWLITNWLLITLHYSLTGWWLKRHMPTASNHSYPSVISHWLVADHWQPVANHYMTIVDFTIFVTSNFSLSLMCIVTKYHKRQHLHHNLLTYD